MKKITLSVILLATIECFGLTPKEYYTQLTNLAPYSDSWKSDFPTASKAAVEKSARAMAEQETRRKVASDLDQEFFESKMSPAMKEFREKFLQVKTADQLDALLLKANEKYDSYPADLKFIVAQVLPLRALRGIIWRLIPTVEDTKMAHSLILTQVKSIAVNMKLLLPTEQWQAGFDYVTQPFVENGIPPFVNTGKVVAQFERGNETSVQVFFRSQLIPALRESSARLEKLDLSSDLSVWDNKLLYGSGSFPTAMDRYALFGEVERHAALSNIYAVLSEACFQSAYSIQGSLRMNQEIGRLYGWDGTLNNVDGVPAAKRVSVIRKPQYASWGLLFQDGKQWTSDAWMFLTRSVEHGDQMWEAMKSRPVSETFMVSNAYALPFQRPIENRFKMLKRITQGPAEVRSFITDEKVTVNLKEYYLNPPADLKQLYATGFEGGLDMITTDLKVGDKTQKVKYRNYYYGRPTQWNLSVYRPYFPDVKSNEDLKKTVRVLTQGWGTFIVAVPLINYMN
ncbi:MAG: hypothetical protein IPM97_12670 [Bdellovibrionaceae bacterium]|nr:hypothetical protein [Pseudobdellovibrionaceae bacterium]